MLDRLRYLLMQIRNPDDPIRTQEVGCFARALQCDASHIGTHDLLTGPPAQAALDASDMVLIGGSGHYSVTSNEPWLHRALDAMRMLHDQAKPTFASCWGFQGLARALGGQVRHDMQHAELGTLELHLTDAGRADPVFGALPSPFRVQAGHEDCVVELPPGATLMASSDLVAQQAFRLDGLPIYATQFHPELDLQTLIDRVNAYPEYCERIAGISIDEFARRCTETPEARSLLLRFVRHVFR